jgi:hypothetical protein
MSWFGTKAEQGVVYASPRNSLDKKRSPYSTPHDAILADLHSSPGDRVASPESTDLNLVITPTPSVHLYQPSRLSSQDLLLDPFNGTSLGTLLPHSQDSEVQLDYHSMPSQVNLPSPGIVPDQSANSGIPSELVWSHLTHIMDLQSQISKKHLEMENIGNVDVKNKKHVFSHKPTVSTNASTTNIGSGAKRTVSETLSTPPGSSTRERALSTASTISSSDGDPVGDENVDVPSEEAEKNRAREEEFASLAHQFEGRKEAINDIMGKVCKFITSRTCV